MLKKAIFLDRDGVINEVLIKEGQPHSPHSLNELRLMPRVAKNIEAFKQCGFLCIVVTNQPDVRRGLLTPGALTTMHEHIKSVLNLDDILVCTHDDRDNCLCRKPRPGMLLEAAQRWGIDLASSYMVGDQERDMQAAQSAGCRGILCRASYNKQVQADFTVDSLDEVVSLLRLRMSHGKNSSA
ncbi:MAG: HAD family hydrolase [Candidatus Omnitrophica bacterium]|nr:HAD family hydrolase [Candidatus Omnitrophota bacterium]